MSTAPPGTRWMRRPVALWPAALWPAARRLGGPVVSVVSLAAVVWWALHQQAPRWPTGASSLLLLALAALVYVGVTAVRGVRWYAILRRAGVPASMADAQALVVVGYMGNTVLPARGGELLRMFFMGGRTGCSRVVILGTIVAERLLDTLALLAMLLLLALVTATDTGGSSQLGLMAAIVLLVLAVALLSGWWLSRTGRLRGLGGRVASLTLASRNLLSVQGVGLVLLTAVVWVGEGCIYWLVGRALGLPLGLLQGCFLVALSSLAATIPAAPGYAGTYDAAIQLGLDALHVHGGRAVAFGLLVRLVIFVPITVAGLILVVVRYGGLASLTRIRRAGASAVRSTTTTSSAGAPSATLPPPEARVAEATSSADPATGPATLRGDLRGFAPGKARTSTPRGGVRWAGVSGRSAAAPRSTARAARYAMAERGRRRQRRSRRRWW
jgi:glycosyltransferase 2 family protein